MRKTRQMNIDESVSFINTLLKSGRTVTKTVFNGIIKGHRRVLVEWIEPKTLSL